MPGVRGPAWLAVLGTILVGGGVLVWVIGAMSRSLLFEAVGQILYGLGCATWGVRMKHTPIAGANRTFRQGPLWLIIAGIGFAVMTIIELFTPGLQD